MGYYVIKKAKNAPLSKTLLGGGLQQYYFVLKASNGETIATSEMYNSKQAAQQGINSVRINAPAITVRDETHL